MLGSHFQCSHFRWFQQHEHLEKLNMQAVVNAAAKEDEFVKDFFISYDKVSQIILNVSSYVSAQFFVIVVVFAFFFCMKW